MHNLKVTTLNANGIRSALRKGLLEWVRSNQPDVILMQEVRSEPRPEALPDYFSAWFPAQKAGYSGVAIFSKHEMQDIHLGMGHSLMDFEGRTISAVVSGVRFISTYLPSGSSSGERQDFKEAILPEYQSWVNNFMNSEIPLVIGGDYNIAHHNIDIKNWRSNQKSSGFLPQERSWLSSHLESGLTDCHRTSLGERAEYTWWSNRGSAYANNVGWRIDYLLSHGIEMVDVSADRDTRLSDHAALSGILIKSSITHD